MLYDSSSVWAELSSPPPPPPPPARVPSAEWTNGIVAEETPEEAAPLRLAYMSIFDKFSQQMWLDIGFSRDGVAFDRVQPNLPGNQATGSSSPQEVQEHEQEDMISWPPTATRKFWAPLGLNFTWNGGETMSVLSANTVRVGGCDYAILPYVSNRPELLWGMEVVKNNTPAGMASWVQRMMKVRSGNNA